MRSGWVGFWLIVFFIIIPLFLGTGCASAKSLKSVEAAQLSGECFDWHKIQKESYGKNPCMKSKVNKSGRLFVCYREQNHKGWHHSHEMGECRWTWKP